MHLDIPISGLAVSLTAKRFWKQGRRAGCLRSRHVDGRFGAVAWGAGFTSPLLLLFAEPAFTSCRSLLSTQSLAMGANLSKALGESSTSWPPAATYTKAATREALWE